MTYHLLWEYMINTQRVLFFKQSLNFCLNEGIQTSCFE